MNKFFAKKITEDMIVQQGCFGPEENRRIYKKFFEVLPQTFLIPLQKYRLPEKRVLDIGCTYGHYLSQFGEGSIGLDINDDFLKFASSIGLKVIHADAEGNWPEEIPRNFDAAWCANLLEHVQSPYRVLNNIFNHLKPGGVAFLKVPIMPPAPFAYAYRLLGRNPGYGHHEHISAFTERTIRFTIERAGFQIKEVNVFYPPYPPLANLCNPFLKRFGVTVTVVAERLY